MGVRSAAFVALVGIVTSSGVASAQISGAETAASAGPGIRLVGGFLAALIVGAIALGVKTRWTRVTTNHLEANVAKSIVVGLVAVVVVGVVAGVLIATGVGAIIGIPLFLVFVVVALVGTAIGALAIGRVAAEAVGVEGEWPALGIGAACYGVLNAVPLVGQFMSLLVGSAGVGIILLRWLGSQ